ncbi:hypothetical protein ACQRBL_03455, partial [Bacillus sp. AF62]|uniref:hypothetical protein n=1 Tax=Bacillus sp. AF62 TaxID=3158960 RepID=UPI003CFD55D4
DNHHSFIKLSFLKNETNSFITQVYAIPKNINGNTFLVICDQIRYRKYSKLNKQKIKEHSVYKRCCRTLYTVRLLSLGKHLL